MQQRRWHTTISRQLSRKGGSSLMQCRTRRARSSVARMKRDRCALPLAGQAEGLARLEPRCGCGRLPRGVHRSRAVERSSTLSPPPLRDARRAVRGFRGINGFPPQADPPIYSTTPAVPPPHSPGDELRADGRHRGRSPTTMDKGTRARNLGLRSDSVSCLSGKQVPNKVLDIAILMPYNFNIDEKRRRDLGSREPGLFQ